MSTVVVETGPWTVRCLCGGAAVTVPPDLVAAALDGIDDAVTLLDERPVAVASVWRRVMKAVLGRHRESVVIVYPSWWSASRIAVVTDAAGAVANDVVPQSRSGLLGQAPVSSTRVAAIVEIAPQLVMTTDGDSRRAILQRHGEPASVADAVAREVRRMTRGMAATVAIDAPTGVGGAVPLAAMIADRLRATETGLQVVVVDDARLLQLATAGTADDERAAPEPAADTGRARCWRGNRMLVAAAAVLATVVLAAGMRGPDVANVPSTAEMPMTFLLEGRVTVQVPAQWTRERVTSGPGSARVQVVSPSDPDTALHVTQSWVPAETLDHTAQTLRHAVDAQPAGLFVDFNPSDRSAGRPAVTYREVRAGHQIKWTVLVDGSVRISVGCQSAPGRDDSVRYVCEQAVKSARGLG